MQTPAPGHVRGAKVGSDPPLASAGSGVGVTTQVPDERFQNRPVCDPFTSDWPTASQDPAAGQAMSCTSMFAPAGVPTGVGAVDGVQVPDARVSKRPCSAPDS